MPLPESTRVVFRKNPIAEVICQLRFPPILEIAAREPVDFQKVIRATYPLYERVEGLSIPREVAEVLARIPGGKSLSPAEDVNHRFTIADGHRSISLNREFVAVSETQYQKWELFRGAILEAKAALESVYQPPFYSRIGLRYQNVISRKLLGLEGRPWSQLIAPHFLGLLGSEELEPDIKQTQTQTLLSLGPTAEGAHALVRYGLQQLDTREECFVIDADLFFDGRRDGSHVMDLLAEFNRLDGNLFRSAIQADLVSALDPSGSDS